MSCERNESSLKSEVIFKNSNVTIEKVPITNVIVNSLLQSEEWTLVKHNEYDIDFKNINLITLNYSEIQMLFFPIHNSSKSLIVYAYHNKYLPVFSEEIRDKIHEDESTIIVYDTFGEMYNTFKFKDNKCISFTEVNIFPSQEVFGGKIGYTAEYNYDTNTTLRNEQTPCNQSTTNFSDCMDCAIAHMLDDWVGIISFAVLPRTIILACVIHCM